MTSLCECGAELDDEDFVMCPVCEQAYDDMMREAYAEEMRGFEYQRWLEENGPDGHGW